MKPDKLNITFIGAGKIAHSLAGALIEHGVCVSSVISRSLSSAKILAEKFNIPAYSDSVADINKKSNLIVLSVPDGELHSTAKKISKLDINFGNKTFIHLSGSFNINVLKPLAGKGAKTASLHLIQTFPIREQIPIKGCYAAIETDDKKIFNFLKSLAELLELIPFSITSEAKTYYHIATVFVCNFLAGNIFAADKNIDSTGIELKAKDIFAPIISTTLTNINNKGPIQALSGPIERNDLQTIKRHISGFKKAKGKINKHIHLSYLAQSLLLLQMAQIKKEDTASYEELNNSLVEELKKLVNLI